MAGDSDHKPLKPAHPAVKSIAGTGYKALHVAHERERAAEHILCHADAGSIGGAAEACCLQPIDVIKTRLQLDHVGKYKGKKMP